jgi:hypothetical protein
MTESIIVEIPADGSGAPPVARPPTPEEEAALAAIAADTASRITYAETRNVHAVARTTDDVPKEVLRFACDQHRLYQASLTVSGIDDGTFASKIMEGRFTWKRVAAGAVMVGVTVVSDIHDAAAAPLAPAAAAAGNDIVFTVKGVAGRTVDWLLAGTVAVYAPTGLEA